MLGGLLALDLVFGGHDKINSILGLQMICK
jgi:hypothetical protein